MQVRVNAPLRQYPPTALATAAESGRGDATLYDAFAAYRLFFLLPSLGPLIVPLVYYFWKRGRLEGEDSEHDGLLQGLVWSSVVCFAAQFVIMMAPHFLYHYPYFVMLALPVIAIVTVMKLSNSILRIAALLNCLLFQ